MTYAQDVIIYRGAAKMVETLCRSCGSELEVEELCEACNEPFRWTCNDCLREKDLPHVHPALVPYLYRPNN